MTGSSLSAPQILHPAAVCLHCCNTTQQSVLYLLLCVEATGSAAGCGTLQFISVIILNNDVFCSNTLQVECLKVSEYIQPGP